MSARNLDGSSTSGQITFDSVEAVLSASGTVTGMRVLDRRHPFSYTVRADTLGPITVLNATIGSDTWIQVSEVRTYYEIVVPITGLIQLSHRGRSIMVTREVAAVQVPEGELTVDRWQAGTRLVVVRIGRSTVEDALSEVVGPIASQIDFEPTMSRKCSAVRSWIRMAELLNHELNQPNSPVTSPLVAAPFVDSMVRALLLTANHPYRDALITSNQFATPANVRAVIDIMEAEADSALTVSSLAARANQCARSARGVSTQHRDVARRLSAEGSHASRPRRPPTVGPVTDDRSVSCTAMGIHQRGSFRSGPHPFSSESRRRPRCAAVPMGATRPDREGGRLNRDGRPGKVRRRQVARPTTPGCVIEGLIMTVVRSPILGSPRLPLTVSLGLCIRRPVWRSAERGWDSPVDRRSR